MQKRAYNLLKTWCDTLLTYSVASHSPHLDGALLCPACHVVHGRIGDLAFPLTLLYVKTGERRYIDAADKMITWTDHCLSRPDGSVRNDAGNEWKGISAFLAMSLGESLYHFQDEIPKEIRDKWMKLFVRLSDYVHDHLLKIQPVINYHAGTACEQAMAWYLTGEQRYLDLARQQEIYCRARFDAQGLLYGEGNAPFIEKETEKGCHFIDMGYNIEESLPLLLRYATLTGEQMEFYRDRYRDHMEFLLSDGAIDNSWGSRHNKWTWWGSRTSDGAIEGLALVLDEPMFADACERVLSLYERCTQDGLLALPMAAEADEPVCLHHSFCHAKALAALVLADPVEVTRTTLPCESGYGIKFFQNRNVALISHNGWRATVSASDVIYRQGCENGGGSLTLLMHKTTPVCASTMYKYNPVEPLNMQYLRHSEKTPCMTPRLVFTDLDCGVTNSGVHDRSVPNSGVSDSLLDSGVRLEQISPLELRAVGADFEMCYVFGEDVTIHVKSARPARYMLPIIKSGEITVGDGCVSIGRVEIIAEKISCGDCGFNQVGGFIWLPLSIDVDGEACVVIRMR